MDTLKHRCFCFNRRSELNKMTKLTKLTRDLIEIQNLKTRLLIDEKEARKNILSTVHADIKNKLVKYEDDNWDFRLGRYTYDDMTASSSEHELYVNDNSDVGCNVEIRLVFKSEGWKALRFNVNLLPVDNMYSLAWYEFPHKSRYKGYFANAQHFGLKSTVSFLDKAKTLDDALDLVWGLRDKLGGNLTSDVIATKWSVEKRVNHLLVELNIDGLIWGVNFDSDTIVFNYKGNRHEVDCAIRYASNQQFTLADLECEYNFIEDDLDPSWERGSLIDAIKWITK